MSRHGGPFDICKNTLVKSGKRKEKMEKLTEDKKTSKLPPIHGRRRSHSGYVVKNKIPISWKSLSTTSTTSLGQLREKLTALPRLEFNKLPDSVCALPDLSIISEVSEKSEVNSIASSTRTVGKSYKITSGRAAGVQKDAGVRFAKITQKFKTIAEEATEKVKDAVKERGQRQPSPVNEDDVHSTSLQLVATLGSDESVINDTVERLPEHVDCTTENIVELLAREALQNRTAREEKERLRDSGINTDCKRTQDNSETIDNTPELTTNKFVTFRKKNKRNSTSTDESNTEVIKETPVNYVSSRKKPQACLSTCASVTNITKEFEDDDDDFQIVQDFISQHCTQKSVTNKNAEFNFEILESESNIIDNNCLEMENSKKNIKQKPSLSLKFTPEKKKIMTPKSRKNKKTVKKDLKLKNKKVDSIVDENEIRPEKTENKLRRPERRRRKLFSPRAESDEIKQPQKYISETEDDETVLSKTNIINNYEKLKATSYKDIEKDRKQRTLQVREGKSKCTYSGKSKNTKMDYLFDKLKDNITNPEQIKLVDKKNSGNNIAIYNFSSDEDEDFKRKTINVGERTSATTIASLESTTSTRRGRVVKKLKYPEHITDTSSGTSKVKPVKKQKKRKTKTVKNKKQTEKDMIDQTMRKAIPVDLNTSLVQEKVEENVVETLEIKINQSPQMEPIPEVDLNLEVKEVLEKGEKRVQKKRKIIKALSTKKQVNMIFDAADIDMNKTDSPLPGLIIEKMPQRQKHGNDSISAITLNNLQKIIQDCDNNERDQNAPQNILSQDNTFFNTNMEIENEMNALIICDDSNESKKERSHTPLIENRIENVKAKSDRSMSTMGNSPITAHGDLNEEPPHTKTLKEVIEPRQLELQDLNESEAAYFKKLENEISRSTELHREPIDDLQTTMQLFENLDYTVLETNPEANVKSTTSERDDKRFRSDDTTKWIPAINFNFDSDESSCKVSEDPIEGNIEHSNVKTTSEKKELKIVMQRLSTDEISRWVTPRNSIDSEKNKDLIVVNAKKSTGEEIQKSFAIPNSGRKVDTEKVFDLVSLSESQLSKGSIKLCFKISRGRSENKKSRDSKGDHQSKEKAINIPSKSPTKRKQSPAPQHDPKRSRVEESASRCDSGPSISSVTEWFNKHGGSLDDEDLTQSLRDNVKNVMEKLDTTLAEIHQSTSRKLIRVFVNAQKNLATADGERTKLLKEFAERSGQLNKAFMEELKRQACTTIREDSKQKRNMVHLLKEDLHSIIDKLDRQRIEGRSFKK